MFLTTVHQWLSLFLVVDLTVQQCQIVTHMILPLYTYSFVKPFPVQFALRNTKLFIYYTL